MSDIKILHNPRCSKSRATRQILDDQGVEYEVVEYLKNPPTASELEEILQMLDMQPLDLMRKGEKVFKELNLGDTSLTRNQLIKAMADNPILVERPIVIHNGKAIIGRPPEQVMDIL